MRTFLLTLIILATAHTAGTQALLAQSASTISGFPTAEDGASLSFPVGDTRIHVRFAGVTAPALNAYPYGSWAHLALGDVIAGNEVSCRLTEDQVAGPQKLGICVAPGLGDLAHWAVMNGFAVPEPGAAGDPYVAAARDARRAKRGIWGGVR